MRQRRLGAVVLCGLLVACSGASADEGAGNSSAATDATTAPTGTATPTDPTDLVFGGTSLRVTGTGNAVVPLPPGNERFVVHATFSGTGRFFVSGIGPGDEPGAPLVMPRNGPYDGTQLIPPPLAATVALSIGADGEGEWTVELIDESTLREVGADFDGQGDTVVRYAGAAGFATVEYDGSGSFFVRTAAGDDIVPYHVGSYTGRVAWPEGPVVVQITADGDWNVLVGSSTK